MNLIICTTPLQTLLAKEIVKNYEDEKFYGILFSNHFSEKVDRYFNLFGVLCHVLNKIYCKSLIRLVCLILYYKIKFFNKKFDKIFVANIENIFDMTKYIAIFLRYIIIIIVLFLNILCVIL